MDNLITNLRNLKRKFYYFIELKPYKSITIFFISIIIILTKLLVAYNDSFDKFSSALWWMVISLITSEPGYADMYPETFWGQLVQLLVVFLGISIFGTIIARLSDFFIEHSKRKELGLVKANYQDHFIICGWSNKAKEIINQILTESIDYKRIVLIANIEKDPYPDNNLIHFISGAIDDEEVLKEGNINEAKSAIVLNEDEEDSTTVLSALTIKNLNPDLHTIAEISKEQNVIHFKNAGVDEVVVNSTVNSQLLFRSAVYGGTSQVVGELLSNKFGNEIYMFEARKEDIGEKYIDLFTKYKHEEEKTLIGVKRNNETIINLSSNERICNEDILIYISLDK